MSLPPQKIIKTPGTWSFVWFYFDSQAIWNGDMGILGFYSVFSTVWTLVPIPLLVPNSNPQSSKLFGRKWYQHRPQIAARQVWAMSHFPQFAKKTIWGKTPTESQHFSVVHSPAVVGASASWCVPLCAEPGRGGLISGRISKGKAIATARHFGFW